MYALLSAKVGEGGSSKQVIQHRGEIDWNLIKHSKNVSCTSWNSH